MTAKILIFDSEAPFYARELAARLPGPDYVAATDRETALAHAPEARVIIGLAPFLDEELIGAARRLEWVQALTTGVDNLLGMAAMRGVALTNCRGIHGPQMSELAIMLMLALNRQFPRMIENQRNRRWDRFKQPLLQGRRLCIIGLGSIAETLTRLAVAFGMRVSGVSDGRTEMEGVERIFPRAELARAMAEADFTVVLVPYSPQTHHIVGEREIRAMKPTGYLINIARGGCVDEDALVAALREGRIAGAALDVFSRTPLPPDSPIWTAPNCIVTPHVGGFSDSYHEQALPVLLRNVAAWLKGGTAALEDRLDRE